VDARNPDSVAETPVATPTGPILAPAARSFALSPINRRRWENFKRNRRGYVALWLFMILFVISLFAEFIANDKPLYLRFDGQSYFPAFITYPDTAFGEKGDPNLMGTAADFRDDPYLRELIEKKGGWMIWPLIPFRYDTRISNPPSAFPPSRPGHSPPRTAPTPRRRASPSAARPTTTGSAPTSRAATWSPA
jgi:microcin C transport system permease protein